MKRGHQRNKETNKERNRHTWRLLNQLGPEGLVGENYPGDTFIFSLPKAIDIEVKILIFTKLTPRLGCVA